MADKIVVLQAGRGGAGGLPARALSPSGQSVRGRVHRVAADELPGWARWRSRRRGKTVVVLKSGAHAWWFPSKPGMAKPGEARDARYPPGGVAPGRRWPDQRARCGWWSRLGGLTLLHVAGGVDGDLTVQTDGADPTAMHQAVRLSVDAANCHVFDQAGQALTRTVPACAAGLVISSPSLEGGAGGGVVTGRLSTRFGTPPPGLLPQREAGERTMTFLGLDLRHLLGQGAAGGRRASRARHCVRPARHQPPGAGPQRAGPGGLVGTRPSPPVDALKAEQPAALAAVRGIGLSGQMHGAVLLDAAGQVLRPAILWNDVRAEAECRALEAAWPDLRQVTGNIAMPGFTAPKLLWVRTHEPEIFARLRTVLLPKAYIAHRLTGELIEEMSDASGPLWLDVAARDWSDTALAATGLTRAHMPRLVEGQCARRDAPPGPGCALGDDGADPGRWRRGQRGRRDRRLGHQARRCVRLARDLRRAVRDHGPGAPLAAGRSARFLPRDPANLAPDGRDTVGRLLAGLVGPALHGAGRGGVADGDGRTVRPPGPALFASYLGGERTPHNDGGLRAGFIGLSNETGRPALDAGGA